MEMNVRYVLMIVTQLGFKCYCMDTLGPASVELEKIEECENPSIYKDPFNIFLTRINRTHYGITGRYELYETLDKLYRINVTAAKWGDGGWKPNAFNFVSFDPCNALMKNANKLWTSIQRAVGVEEKCPMPAGSYGTENYLAPLENMFPSMLYGKFRADISLESNGEPLLCMRFYVTSFRASKGHFG